MKCFGKPIAGLLGRWGYLAGMTMAVSVIVSEATRAIAHERQPTPETATSASGEPTQLRYPEDLTRLPADGREVNLSFPAFRLRELLQDGAAPSGAKIQIDEKTAIRLEFRSWTLHGPYDPDSGRLVAIRGNWKISKSDKPFLDVDHAEFPANGTALVTTTPEELLDAPQDGRWAVLRIKSKDLRRVESDPRRSALQLRTSDNRDLTLIRPGVVEFKHSPRGEILVTGHWTRINGDKALVTHDWFEHPSRAEPIPFESAAGPAATSNETFKSTLPFNSGSLLSAPIVMEGRFFHTLPTSLRDPTAPERVPLDKAYLVSRDGTLWIGLNLPLEPKGCRAQCRPSPESREPPPYQVSASWLPLPLPNQLVRVFGQIAMTPVGNRLVAYEIVPVETK